MKKLIVFALVLFVSSSLHAQQARQIISYQGAITALNGAAVRDSIYPIAVTLYTDSSGGTALWRDVFETPVKNGVFNIALGSGLPLPTPSAMDRPLWLGVNFNGAENNARFQLGTVPTALNVADSSITTAKLADHSVTWNKMGTDYVPYIRVNGSKVNTGNNPINFTGGEGLKVDFDSNSMSVVIRSDSTLEAAGNGKGAKSLWVGYPGCSSSDGGVITNTVAGGCSNTINTTSGTPAYGTITGGQANSISSTNNEYTFIGGGYHNTINDGIDGVISGGYQNHLEEENAVIGGGINNWNGGPKSVIGGGESNIISFNTSGVQTTYFTENDTWDVIDGGYSNRIDTNALYASIGGGSMNRVLSNYSIIAGGLTNFIDRAANAASIGGGDSNFVSGNYAAIAGGAFNHATGSHSAVAGGYINYATNTGSDVAGGENNTSSGDHAAIMGGQYNTASGSFSSILGGRSLTLGDSSVGFNGSKSSTVTNLNGFQSVAYLGDVNLWLGNVDDRATALRFYSPNTDYTYGTGAHYSSVQAGGQTSNIIYTLPTTTPDSNGRALGVISGAPGSNLQLGWVAASGGGGGLAGWLLSGNSGTTAGPDYVGTQDSAAFEIHVLDTAASSGGNKRVMRYTFGSTSPNILGGSSANLLGNGLSGAAILSGGSLSEPNIVRSSFSVIAGGFLNLIDTFADHSFIGSGHVNYIGGPFCVIGGGDSNTILASGADHNVIGGGLGNYEYDPSYGTISGGAYNVLGWDAYGSGIAGGMWDTSYAELSFIGAGWSNVMKDSTYGSAIVAGDRNYTGSNLDFIGSGEHNQVLADHSAIVGGTSNTIIQGSYSFLGGGLSDTMLSAYAFLGGGQSNKIDVNADHSTVTGGKNNSIFASFSVLAGGDSNIIQHNAGYSVIGGGTGNLVDSNALYSTISGGNTDTIDNGVGATIGGGQNNIIQTQNATIGGGVLNFIAHSDCPCGSTIGGGFSDSIVSLFPHWSKDSTLQPPFMCTIAGGELNSANAVGASIGGGYNNRVLGSYGTIPGGVDLIAGYQQTVIGTLNDTSGLTSGDLFIVGNGTGVGPVRSNAFEISNNGHSIVHDINGNSHTGFGLTPRLPIYGGTYQDNGIIAWGDITSGGFITADVGVESVTMGTQPGTYIIKLWATDSKDSLVTFTNASITATLRNNDTTGVLGVRTPDGGLLVVNPSKIDAPSCGKIEVTQIGIFNPPNQNVFVVHTYNGSNSCDLTPEPFFFKVCARP